MSYFDTYLRSAVQTSRRFCTEKLVDEDKGDFREQRFKRSQLAICVTLSVNDNHSGI